MFGKIVLNKNIIIFYKKGLKSFDKKLGWGVNLFLEKCSRNK